MYLAHVKREAVMRATEVRNAMISGMWSNSNLDDGKGSRTQALTEIEENFQNTIRLIYSGKDPNDDILLNHPLFTAMNLDDPPEVVPLPTTENLN